MKKITISTILLLVFLFPLSTVYAVNLTGLEKAKEKIVRRALKQSTRAAEMKEKAKERLGEVKAKVCEKKVEIIKKRSSKLSDRVEKTINVFDRHAEKVKNYYEDKLVPKGVSVENYDALLTAIETKKQASLASASEAAQIAVDFNCGEEVKPQLETYRNAMKKVITALQEYKKSIVDLIVAVRTAVAEKQKETTSSAQ